MRIIFSGTPDFAVPALQMLIDSKHDVCAVYTQPDRPSGRGRKLVHSPVKAVALEQHIPVYQPETFRADEEIEQLAALDADLMVVVAYGIILPQAILDTPRLGCINIHGSLLPRWRGAAPIHRALIAGDVETGVTIMKLVKKLDAGDMLHKEYCAIESDSTSSELHDKLAALGAMGLEIVLNQIDEGTVVAKKQNEAAVTYAEKLDKSESELDWNLSALELDRKIRGFNSWPVAQTLYQGKTLRIWKSVLVDDVSNLPPGTVSKIGKRLRIATGKGCLDVLEIQLPGKRKMSVEAFLNAHNVDAVILGN